MIRDEKNGGLIVINKEKLEIQKQAISFLASKLGSNLLSGKNPM